MSRLILTGSSRCGTTITRHILSRHPEIYLTNELRLYWETLLETDPHAYFKHINKNCVKRDKYHRLPKDFDINHFNNEIKKTDNNIINKITTAENGVFKNKPKFYGDKGATLDVLDVMVSAGMVFKLIFIYRDGRDVAYSGFRQLKGRKDPPWSDNIVDNAVNWAEKIDGLLNRQEDNEWLSIKFEDYMENPEKNMNLIASYLGVDPFPLLKAQNNLLNSKKSHVGYYKEGWPNWKKESPKIFLDVLKRLEYI